MDAITGALVQRGCLIVDNLAGFILNYAYPRACCIDVDIYTSKVLRGINKG